jgi:hypothetical protein
VSEGLAFPEELRKDMHHLILQIDDKNIAGFAWRYEFWLERTADESFSLRLEQTGSDELSLQISPSNGLRTGAAVFRALSEFVEQAGYELESFDCDEVASHLESLDNRIATEFRSAVVASGEGEDTRASGELSVAELEARLAPYRCRIESFVERFSDDQRRYPGSGRYLPSRRSLMRSFLEEYVVSHGGLPVGREQVRVRGLDLGEHDFSELSVDDPEVRPNLG